MASNWAIVIGINQYRFLQPLKYAKRDAESIQNFLMQEAKFDLIFLFTDDSPPINGKPTEPFRANLLRVLRQIFEKPFMKDGDNFWFFFSGHGIPHKGQDYLMPLDGDPEDVENTGISTNTITNYLRSCGADNTVMILDACRSGGKKAGEGIGRQTEAEACQTGVISLFSCSPDQYSYELESIGQGAFTYALLEGLGIRGQCATVERLNQYLEHRVPELVTQHLGRVRQIPYAIAEPLNRSHLILMPQHASLADIATLKNDAYRAQMNQNWDLAQQLWIRVLAAASGPDMEAIEALQDMGIQRHTKPTSSQPEPPQTAESSQASFNSTPPPQKDTAQRSTPTTLTNSASTASSFPVPNPISQLRSQASPVRVTGLPRSTTESRSLTRRQVLKWAIPAGVGVVGVTIASQLTKVPSQPTSPLSSPSPAPSPSTPVDYSKLEEFLKAGNWKEADAETASLMLRVAKREEENWLDEASIKSFPCDVLSRVDRLWVGNSNSKFGFSIQKKIYVENCGGRPDGHNDEKAWQCFGEQVGWRVNKEWIKDSQIAYSTQALGGHLPTPPYWKKLRDSAWRSYRVFFSHAETCKL
ncbi:GUN4 domain-containing protein [Cyanobacteria bacterium FACHB-63]|nr:GUN4 domain-containing protein [Cyanobacteria bacterium FACHB-63]